MNIISTVHFITFIFYIFIGLYIFTINIKSKINKLFFIKCLFLSLWSFTCLYGLSTKITETAFIWYKISTLGWIFYPLVPHFCIEFFYSDKKYKNLIYLLYIPVLFFVINEFAFTSIFIKSIHQQNDLWILDYRTGELSFALLILYFYLCRLIAFIILIVFYKKSKVVKKKKMSMLFIIALAIATVLTNLEVHIMPIIISDYNSFGIAATFYLPWIITFYYSIVKFKFLSVTPELVSKDIIENINDAIILLDNKLNIMTINNKAGKLLNCSLSDIKLYDLSKIVLESISLQNEINKMINDNYNSFSIRIHFTKNDNSNILMDATFKIVNDKFGDFLGILIIGKEVKELKQLKTFYKITNKEAIVLQHVVNGVTNRDIADKIGISERTVKAHISNIYDKFGVDNRIQLLGFLKDFNLIPEQNAEKIIIL